MAKRQVSIFINRKRITEDLDQIEKKAEELTKKMEGLTEGSKEYNKTTKELDRLNLIIKKHKDTITIAGREIANDLNSIQGEYRLIERELKDMTRGQDGYQDKVKELQQLKNIIQEHRDDIRGVKKEVEEVEDKIDDTVSAYDKIKAGLGNFVGIAAGALAADRIVDYGKQLFKLGTEMEVLGRKAETVFAEALPQVTRAAEENANAMGLTRGQYVDAAAAMGDLLIPMQFSREETARLTTNTVNLSGALAEWTGGQKNAEEVSKILSKALLGEREELKQLGIAINEADVKQRLKEKGVENLTGKLLEQAKATATLELITEKSTDAQAAFIENADLNIRTQAELNAKFQEVNEKLATALLPVFAKLVDIASITADVIDDVVSATTALFNPVQGAADAFDDQASKVASLESELNPLLTRYDELKKKSKLSKDEQNELKDVIKKIGEITPTAITAVDDYGNALSINADKSREFLEAEKARLEFVNKESIQAIETQIEKLEGLQQVQKRLVETGETGGIISVSLGANEIEDARQKLNQYTRELEGARAQLARLSGADLDNQNTDTKTPEQIAAEEEAKRLKELELQKEAEAEERRKKRKKERERELKAQEKQFEKLLEAINKFEEEVELSELDEEKKKEARVLNKFDKEIQLAKALEEAKFKGAADIRQKLEDLRDEQEEIFKEQRIEKEKERQKEIGEAFLEGLKEFQERKKEVEAELKAAADEVLLDEQNLALLRLEENYLSQLALAEQFGVETNRITEAYRQQKAEINNKFNLKEKKDRQKAQKEQADLLIKGFETFSSGLTAILQVVGKEGAKATAFSKLLATAQIGIKTAEAIAEATAAATDIPFPGNIFAIGASIGTVLANIAQATSILNGVSVPQKRKGSFFKVKGQDDGFTYNAKYLGQQQTGMLPSYPVLLQSVTGSPVLASEAGSEYFVANQDLQNPAIFNYVQAIENIKRTRQFVDGGFTNPDVNVSSSNTTTNNTATADQTAATNTVMLNLLSAINRLNDNLERGTLARFGDEEVSTISDRLKILSQASGGFIT
jgi:hypothetical protein